MLQRPPELQDYYNVLLVDESKQLQFINRLKIVWTYYLKNPS